MMVEILERSACREVLSDSRWQPREELRPIRRNPDLLTDITSASRPMVIPFGEGAIFFSEAPSPRFHHLLTWISELGDLEENWDSYGACPVRPECAVTAVRFLLRFVDRDTPAPSVVPTNRGGIQLEWHRAGADLEVRIESPGRMEVFFEDERADQEEEFTLTSNLKRLVPLLERLSRTD